MPPIPNVPRLLAALAEELSVPRRDFIAKSLGVEGDWVDECAAADPTGGKYTVWIARLRKAGNIRLPEDADKVRTRLAQFQKLSRTSTWEAPKDLMKYGTYADLARAVEAAAPGKKEVVRVAREKGMDLLASGYGKDGAAYSLYAVTTPEAAAKHFRHTEWCVKDPHYYHQYGPPFYYLTRDEAPYKLMHFDEFQCQDVMDESTTPDEYEALGFDVVGRLKTPWDLTTYAITVRRDEWPEKESEIAGDTKSVLRYLGAFPHRLPDWPEGEQAILESPEYLRWYVTFLGRYPHPKLTSSYPELEAAILASVTRNEDPHLGDTARAVLNADAGAAWAMKFKGGRWPELEAAVGSWETDPNFLEFLDKPEWLKYVKTYLKEWPAMERWVLSEEPSWRANAAAKVLHSSLVGGAHWRPTYIRHLAMGVAKRIRDDNQYTGATSILSPDLDNSTPRLMASHLYPDMYLWNFIQATSVDRDPSDEFAKAVRSAMAEYDPASNQS